MRFRNLYLIAVIMILILTLIPVAQAAPKAVIYEKEVTASPAVQGRRLPIEIKCEVGFGGACCYTVYAHDIEVEIFLPENATLLSGNKKQVMTSSGQSSGTISVEPGGGLTWSTKTWTVQAEEYGLYNITILITGRNELGEKINESANATLTIKSGASISTPVLPQNPIVGGDIIIVAEVSSSDSNVDSVTLYYSKNQENWVAESMENTGQDVWTGGIPSQKSEGEVYYYMESLDETGKTFTTEIYSVQIRDVDRISTIKVISTYGTLAAFILGMVLILYISRRGRIPFVSKGMVILGASLRLSALRGLDEIEDDQERLMRIRKWIAITLIIVMVILLVIAIITGQLQDVIEHTTNPTEA
jgi:hypothetical protein